MGPYSRARWVHMLAARQRRVRTYLARRRAFAVAAALRTGMLSISTVRLAMHLPFNLTIIASVIASDPRRLSISLGSMHLPFNLPRLSPP